MRQTARVHPEELTTVDVFDESVLVLAVALVLALLFALLQILS